MSLDSNIIDLSFLEAELLPSFLAFCSTFARQDHQWSPFLDTLKRFSHYTKLQRAVEKEFASSDALNQCFKVVRLMVCKKFPLLVLFDLGGTIFLRANHKAELGGKKDLVIKGRQIIRRPGHAHFLRTLYEHPRIHLAVFSTIMAKNIQLYLKAIYQGELESISYDATIFDQEYCPLMSEHPKMKVLATDPWDRYKSFAKVLQAPILKAPFTLHNTLSIDSEAAKVQAIIENSIVCEPYRVEDVQCLKVDGVFRDDDWQSTYMR